MPQVLDEPITQPILTSAHPWPEQFFWRGQSRQIRECGGEWSTRGRWWLGEGDKRFFRLLTTDPLTLDLCLDEMTGRWSVAEALD